MLSAVCATIKPVHVLTTRGGELAAPFGPICTNDDCLCNHALASLDSRYPTTLVTVADQPITLEDLEAKAAAFLDAAGWASGDDDELAALLAHDMAAGAAEAAADFDVGTQLRAAFDHADDSWTFTPQ